MSCACGWDVLGRAATVGTLAVLQCLDGGERSRHINKNWYSIISYSSSFCIASSFPCGICHAVGEASVLQTRRNTCSNLC